ALPRGRDYTGDAIPLTFPRSLLQPIMAYDSFEPRVDSLVVETKTHWDPAIGPLSETDKEWLAHAIHQSPAKAAKIHYERAHTGFTREITVTVADLERLYQEKLGG